MKISKMHPVAAASTRITLHLLVCLECFDARLCNSLILFAHPAAYSHRADNLVAAFQRNAARENHDASVVRNVNPEELVARLAQLGQFLG